MQIMNKEVKHIHICFLNRIIQAEKFNTFKVNSFYMLIEKQRHQLEHDRKEKTNFGQSLLERKGQMWSDSEEGGGEGGWCEAEWDDS